MAEKKQQEEELKLKQEIELYQQQMERLDKEEIKSDRKDREIKLDRKDREQQQKDPEELLMLQPKPVYHHERKDSDTSFKTVLNIVNVIHENLHEVAIAGEKLIVIDGQNALSFEWEEYGLKMEIPAHAAGLAGTPPLEIGVVALVAGPFEFPTGTQLVSGVYAIASSRRLDQPVELQMQHCVDLHSAQQATSLYFVRAMCSQSNLPYRFHYMEQGAFSIVHNNFGSIVLEKFSMFAIIRRLRIPSQRQAQQRESSTTPSLLYSAHIYRQPEASRIWVTLFSVTKDLQLLKQYTEEYYKRATFFAKITFKFEKGEIELVLNEEQRKDNWIIRPRTHPCTILQEAVDNMGDSNPEPPTCAITLEAEVKAAKHLYYKVPITGTDKESRCFTIECDLTDPTMVPYYNQISAPPTIPPTTSSTSSHGAAATASTTSSDMATSTILTEGGLYRVKAELPNFIEWKKLGEKLGLYPGTITMIETDYRGAGVNECLDQMLRKWLSRMHNEAEYGPPTWSNLANALEEINHALATNIRKKYC